jgi:hypothetical protein
LHGGAVLDEKKPITEEEYKNLLSRFDQKFPQFEQTARSKKLADPKAPLLDGIRSDSVVLPTKTLLNFTLHVVCKQTGLLSAMGILPECAVLQRDMSAPLLFVCVADPLKCTVGRNCLGLLLERLGQISQAMPDISLFILYWKIEHPKPRIMGVVVEAETSRMKVTIINPHSLSYFVSSLAQKYEVQF